jgi:hypothetical protein
MRGVRLCDSSSSWATLSTLPVLWNLLVCECIISHWLPPVKWKVGRGKGCRFNEMRGTGQGISSGLPPAENLPGYAEEWPAPSLTVRRLANILS